MQMQVVFLAILATASMLLFFPLNVRSAPKRHSVFIEHLPFIPAFIVPYLALFPYIAFSMFAVLLFTPVAARLYVSLIIGGLLAALVWSVRPVSVAERPHIVPRGPLTRTLAWVYSHDARSNAFPSSHTYTALVCSYYLAYAFPVHTMLIWILGSVIVSSTLFIRQHHLADLVAGLALAATSVWFSYLLLGALP